MRLPGAARLVVAALVGRLPRSMGPVAFVLLIHETTGSYAVAGVVMAGVASSTSVCAGPWGRAVDRVGHTRTLLVSTAINAVSLVVVLIVARTGAPVPVLILCGALYGGSLPPLDACMPRMWSVLVGNRPEVERSFALEAITRELIVIGGPLATAIVVALASADAAIVAMIVVMVGGTLAFASSPLVRMQRGGPSHAGRQGAFALPAVRTFVLVAIAVGVALGAVQIAIPAFAEQQGAPAVTGALFACWAVGSMLAGLWYGSRDWRTPVERRYRLALALIPLSLVLLSLGSSLPAMALLMVLAGVPMAPTNTTTYTLINWAAPVGAGAEALALNSAARAFGIAAGSAGAGLLVATAGPSWTLAAGALAAALATPIAAARRSTLRPGSLRGAVVHP